jgi:type I restriction enzyme S subunit
VNTDSSFVRGQCWVGQLPPAWTHVRAKRVFGQRVERALSDDQQLSVTQKSGVVAQTDYMNAEGHKVVLALSGTENFKHVDRDDFVISLRSFQGGIERSLVRGCVSPAYTVLRSEQAIIPDYWAYLFKSSIFVTALRSVIDEGIRDGKSITYEQFGVLTVPRPPLDVQLKIASFLDSRTARIDGLIARKLKFIDLLREKRISVIANAVNGGVNLSVTTKRSPTASGVSIPEHWEVVDFWTVARQVSISGVPHEPLLSVYLDRGVIPYSEGGGLVHKPSESLDEYQLVEPGNFVLNNQQAWRGSVSVSRYRGIVSPAYLIFALSDRLDPAFADYQFRETRFVDELMLSSQGVGDIQRQVKWPLLREAKVFVPPLEEQRRIVSFLERATARIDSLLSKTERSIELLREHRTALITAAVTGKLDVRHTI